MRLSLAFILGVLVLLVTACSGPSPSPTAATAKGNYIFDYHSRTILTLRYVIG